LAALALVLAISPALLPGSGALHESACNAAMSVKAVAHNRAAVDKPTILISRSTFIPPGCESRLLLLDVFVEQA
jgi:hypothetical protein